MLKQFDVETANDATLPNSNPTPDSDIRKTSRSRSKLSRLALVD